MKRLYNDFDDILTKHYKKEQIKKLNLRIRNAKSIINTRSPKSYKPFKKRLNESHGKDEISKIKFIKLFLIR